MTIFIKSSKIEPEINFFSTSQILNKLAALSRLKQFYTVNVETLKFSGNDENFDLRIQNDITIRDKSQLELISITKRARGSGLDLGKVSQLFSRCIDQCA